MVKESLDEIIENLTKHDPNKKNLEKIIKNIVKYSPDYNPKKWNKNIYIRQAHNCYEYFLNKINPEHAKECLKLKKSMCTYKDGTKKKCDCHRLKAQPGYAAGYKRIKKAKKYTCKNLHRRILADNPGIYKARKNGDCREGYYMGALVIHPGSTYHFYRRDSNGRWSHKDGLTKAKNYDAKGNLIYSIKKAARHYKRSNGRGGVNYSRICARYCIPRHTKKRASYRAGKGRKKTRKRSLF